MTQLQREPRDCSASESKRAIRRGAQIPDVYPLAHRLLPALKIAKESITYYASLVSYYAVFRLQQLHQRIVPVSVRCVVYHRDPKMPDHLINGLMYSVRHSHEAAKETAQERVYHRRPEGHEDVAQAAQVLTLFTDDGLPPQTPFHEVQTRACSILAAPQSDGVADHLTTAITWDATAFQWEHLDAVAQQGKRHLRPLLQRMAWASSAAQAPLIEAVALLQAAFAQGRPLRQYPAWALPRRCIPDTATRYGEAPGAGEHRQLLPDRDEFRVYRLLGHGLEAGHILCRDSVRCRSFADDRLDDQTWQAQEPLRAHAGRPLLTQPMRAH